MPADDYLTIADIAELLGVTPGTVHAYRSRGYLPEPARLFGRTPVWTRAVIKKWAGGRPGQGAGGGRPRGS